MYNLLIVEDEEIIRKTLPIIIDWNSIGIEVVGAVENGRAALKFIESNPVDLVLTDIRMPLMNGLELACELKNKYPKIKTILLSAYSDFEYARKGIEYSVHGYLLKSSDEEEIKDYFHSLKDMLDKERVSSAGIKDGLQEQYWARQEEYLQSVIGERGDNHTKKLILKAVDYIRQNYSNDISLADVASHVSVHPVYLSRLFRQELDQTFVNILKEIRIKKAKSLLIDSELKVYEVSSAVGFKKPRYFSEVFKELTGLTPLEYRESH